MCMSCGSHQGSAVPTSVIYNSNLMISVFDLKSTAFQPQIQMTAALTKRRSECTTPFPIQYNYRIMTLKATCELRTSARWNHIHYLKKKKSISECMFSSVCLHEMINKIQTVIHWMNINYQWCWHSLDSQIYFCTSIYLNISESFLLRFCVDIHNLSSSKNIYHRFWWNANV